VKSGPYSNCAEAHEEAEADTRAVEDAAAIVSCRNSQWNGSAVGNACNERAAIKDIAATEFVGRESIKFEDCAAVEVGKDWPGQASKQQKQNSWVKSWIDLKIVH
jgi:hypothetical protein